MRDRLRRYDVVRWGDEQLERLARARAGTRALRERRLSADDGARLRGAWASRPRRRLVAPRLRRHARALRVAPVGRRPRRARLLALLAAPGAARRAPTWSLDQRARRRDARAVVRRAPARRSSPSTARAPRPRAAPGRRPHLAAPEGCDARASRPCRCSPTGCPAPFVERKDVAVAWHWRNADPEIGAARETELVEALGALLQRRAARRAARQARSSRCAAPRRHKGAAARRWLGRGPYDLVLAAGDDTTDEDLFAALPPVGVVAARRASGRSRARFNVDGPRRAAPPPRGPARPPAGEARP